MLRTLTDFLYSKGLAVKWFKSKNPSEEIIFASAATILETKDNAPVGWSFRRLFQHRGVVIITKNQIALKNSLLSLQFLFYLLLFFLSLNVLYEIQDVSSLLVAIFFGLVAGQFLPYQQEISLNDIQDIKLKPVRGIFIKSSLLTISVKDKTIHVVPSQVLNEEIMRTISSHNG